MCEALTWHDNPMTTAAAHFTSVHTALGREFGSLHPLSHGDLAVHLQLVDGLIATCRFQPGFMHRGDEKLLEVRNYRQGLSLINRHQWLSPAAPETSYAQACEELMGLVPPARAVVIRELVCQMQAVTGSLLRLAGIAQSLSQPWQKTLRLREQWLDVHEALTGVRMHSSAVRLGGVANDCNAEDLEKLYSLASAGYESDFETASLKGLGTFDGRDSEQRVLDTIEIVKSTCAAICTLISELKNIDGPIATTLPKVVRVPVGSSYKEVPGANGTTGVWLHSDGGTTPMRVHLNTPSFRNLQLIEQNAKGKSVLDLWAMLVSTPLALGEIDR